MGPGCRRGRGIHLLGERAGGIADDHSRNRLNQRLVLFGHLVGPANEDAAGLVEQTCLGDRGDHAHDLLVKRLPVAGLIFIPNDQVDGQSLAAPIGMGLDQLADERDLRCVGHPQQENGQIPGNAVAPKPGLTAAIRAITLPGARKSAIGIQNASRQPAVKLRFRFGRIDLPQDDLALRPCQFEYAISKMAIVIFLDHRQHAFARLGDAGNDMDAHGLVRAR